jgi:D-aminopeptidase
VSILKRYTLPDGSTRNLSEETALSLGLDPKTGVDRATEFKTPSEVHIAGKPPTSATGIISSGHVKADGSPVVTNAGDGTMVQSAQASPEGLENVTTNEGQGESVEVKTETTEAENKARTTAPNRARRTRKPSTEES